MRNLTTLGAIALFLAGCPGFFGPDLVTGERTPFAGGQAWTTFGTEQGLDGPLSFGVEMDIDLDALPADGRTVILPMPFGSDVLVPYDHVELSWLPTGHEPDGIYDVQHLNVKFSLLSQQERAQIAEGDCQGQPVTCTAYDRALIDLPFEAQPPFHDASGVVLPHTGHYYFDMRGAEWQQTGTYERSVAFAAFDGQIASLDVKVTPDYLQTVIGQNCRTIDNPQGFARRGYHPTEVCVDFDDGLYRIELISWENLRAAQGAALP